MTYQVAVDNDGNRHTGSVRRSDPPDIDDFICGGHSLRINASSVAAVAGYNPYYLRDYLAKFTFDYVYQGRHGAALLRRDAGALRLRLSDDEERTAEILSGDGLGNLKKAFAAAASVAEGGKVLATVGEADTVKKAVETEVARALRAGRIGKADAAFVREAGRGGVDKGFGTANEDSALDGKGEKCGGSPLELL